MDNVLVLACQHILETTVDLFDAIVSKGVRPGNIYLMGKCYSTSENVFEELKERGINVSSLSKAYTSHTSFDEQFKSYINDFFSEIRKKLDFSKFDKIIILDDGGELILCANNILNEFSNVAGVEQTASGYEKIKNMSLNFPVINIAKSHAKLHVESPFIAEVIVRKIKEYLEKILLSEPKMIIVGQGAIGKSLYELLSKDFHTTKYDIVTHCHPFPGEYEHDLHDADVIIGATGKTILLPDYFKKLKQNTLLISASSSDREFSAVYLRKLIEENVDCHKDINVDGIHILNSGFPINFDGSRDSVIAEKIQFTRALLFLGVLEAFLGNDSRNEIIGLDESVQEKIISKFKSL